MSARVALHLDGKELHATVREGSDPGAEILMLAGFADCEELIASMLERYAEEADHKAKSIVLQGSGRDFEVRAMVLREAALAVRLGQHRREVEA
jgi:hypothetical protein